MCMSGGELVRISLRRSFGNVMARVMSNSAHEHEISMAKSRAGSGMSQTRAGGERKDEEEDGEDKEDFLNMVCW